MSDTESTAKTIEPDARDLFEAIDELAAYVRHATLAVEIADSEKEAGLTAIRKLNELFSGDGVGRLVYVIGQRDALAAAINRAFPDKDPILSMSTLRPAGE